MSDDASRQPPPPLPESLRDVLSTFREVEALPSASRERIWKTVGAKEPPRRRFVAPTPVAPKSGRRWVVGAIAAVAAVTLLWIAVGDGVLAGRADGVAPNQAASMAADSDAPAGAAAERAAQSVERRNRSRRTPSAAASPPEPAPEVVDPPLAVDPPSEPREADTTVDASDHPDPTEPSPAVRAPRRGRATTSSDRKPKPAAEPAPKATVTSTLAEEQRLVSRAWAALTSDDPQRALSIARRHLDRFPDGMLGPERDAVLAIARCRTEPASAEVTLRGYRRVHASSPLSSRVRQACAATEEKPSAP